MSERNRGFEGGRDSSLALRFRVQGSGFRVQGPGSRVKGPVALTTHISGLGFILKVQNEGSTCRPRRASGSTLASDPRNGTRVGVVQGYLDHEKQLPPRTLR